ncbi:MAG: GntR family transcriptional regulator, partial [Pseudonocardia sp.]|nr:GntR family transcriptional regulator [Pseudonocardia sp.]
MEHDDRRKRPGPRPVRFARVKKALREELEQTRPGGRLPRTKELAERFGVSMGTVRNALISLQDEGLVKSYGHGRGTWVRAGGQPERSGRERVLDAVHRQLEALEPGERLPTIEAMAKEHGVSTRTVGQVVKKLAANGLAESQGSSSVSGGWVKTGGTPRPTELERVKGVLREQVGRLGPGQRLPTTRILARTHGTGITTMHKALASLAEERVVASLGPGPTGGWVRANGPSEGEEPPASPEGGAPPEPGGPSAPPEGEEPPASPEGGAPPEPGGQSTPPEGGAPATPRGPAGANGPEGAA